MPYCQVPAGAARSGFAETVHFLYNAGSSSGEGSMSGNWPSMGIGSNDGIASKEMVLAVVTCAPPVPGKTSVVSSEVKNTGSQLTASSVPAVCPGQKTLFHGTVKASDDAEAAKRGYAGVLHFPEVPLTCPVGTLRRTISADIEPRK